MPYGHQTASDVQCTAVIAIQNSQGSLVTASTCVRGGLCHGRRLFPLKFV
jgi:hypothetical protein